MQDGTQKSQKVFMNIPTEVGATEAEAIGKHSLPASHGPSSLAAQFLLCCLCDALATHFGGSS